MNYFDCLPRAQKICAATLLCLGLFLILLAGGTGETPGMTVAPMWSTIVLGLIGITMVSISIYIMNVVGKRCHRSLANVDCTKVDFAQNPFRSENMINTRPS